MRYMLKLFYLLFLLFSQFMGGGVGNINKQIILLEVTCQYVSRIIKFNIVDICYNQFGWVCISCKKETKRISFNYYSKYLLDNTKHHVWFVYSSSNPCNIHWYYTLGLDRVEIPKKINMA